MPIEGQAPELKKLSDTLHKEVYGQTIQEANDAKTCINCKQPALSKCHTEAGTREFYISGLCEECFDAMFEEEE
jgi:hypothetical protein